MINVKDAVKRMQTKWIRSSVAFDEKLNPRIEFLEDLCAISDCVVSNLEDGERLCELLGVVWQQKEGHKC